MIHLRVASPPDVTGVLMPMLRSVIARLIGSAGIMTNSQILTAVAIAGLPVQRAIWRRAGRRAALSEPQRTGG